MKRKRLSLIKRIFLCFCCTLLLITNIFLSYNTAVHAKDDFTLNDAIMDICAIILGVGGVLAAPAELTFLGFVGIVAGVCGAVDGVINIYDYVTDNGDGTYTINEEFIQAALQAAEELEAQGFTDSNMEYMGKYLYNYRWSSVESYTEKGPGTNNIKSIKVSCTMSLESQKRIAGYKSVDSGTDSSGCSYISIVYGSYSKNGSEIFLGKRIGSSNGIVEIERDNYSASGGALNTYNSGQEAGIYNGSVSFGGNFPIFSSFNAMNDYLYTGKGYRDAMNYRSAPLFRRHSSYTPTYSGGAVTVNRTVINNINQKITEVDADDSLSDDQKIEILQQYIFSGGNPTPTLPPVPSDPDYDDNKDLPAGEDLTDTNSWLKKIYLKLCQIYAKMNAAVEDAEDAALAKIQESLDEIIVQLKKIKHWAAVDTVIDGVDAIADWLDLIYDVLKNGAGSAVTALSSALEDSTDLMKQKFPFSIPWDILFFVSVLSAEPETPHFEIPFNFEYPALDISVDYQMELDFTHLQWLSDLSRLLLSMTYAAGLMKKTLDIVSANKEG